MTLIVNPNWRRPVKPRTDEAKVGAWYVDWGENGSTIHPSQVRFLNEAFARKRNGDYRYQIIADNMPRQNGKSKKNESPIMSKTIGYGEDVYYTAQDLPMCGNMFRLVYNDILKSSELRQMVKGKSGFSGKEYIDFKNGGSVRFACRKNGLTGMGGTKDCVIFDEAQELTAEYESMIMKVLRTKQNYQLIYTGTPFLPASGGDTFDKLLERAKTDDTVYAVRYGVDDENCDVEDKTLWKLTNPLYPDIITDKSFETDLKQARQRGEEGLRDFRIQDLGLWWKDAIPPAIPAQLWEASVSDAPNDSGTNVHALAFDPQTTMLALAVASYSEDGDYVMGEVIEEEASRDSWDWIIDRSKKWGRDTPLVIDLGGLEKPILDMLDEHRRYLDVVKLNGQEFLASQQGFMNLLEDGKFRHPDNPYLAAEVRNAQKTDSGNGWKFTQIRPDTQVVGLKALSMAAWYRSVTKVKERRKLKVVY